MRFNLSTGRDDLGTLIKSLDLEEIRVPKEAIEALGLTSISESLPLKTVIDNMEMLAGRHAGTKSGRNILARWQGDLDHVKFGGSRVLDDFIIDATQVTGDELVETLDVLQQLIAAHNAVPGGFLDEAWLSMYDDVIEGMLAKANRLKGDKLTSWGVSRIDRQGLLDDLPTMPDDLAQDTRNLRLRKVEDVQEAVRHISDDLADEQAFIADLADDLVVPVGNSQVELLEELVDDWIAQEAELPSNAIFRRPNSNRVELTTEWLADMKARTTQLKADIAEELAELTPGTGPYTNAVARHRQELKTLMDEFSDAYVSEAALKQQVLSRELLGQSADTLREIPGRRWSTRGDGPMSFQKLQLNFYKIKKEFGDAALQQQLGDVKATGAKGLKLKQQALLERRKRIMELIGPEDGPKWKELQSKYPSLFRGFEEITEPEELVRQLDRTLPAMNPNRKVELFDIMTEAVMEGDVKIPDSVLMDARGLASHMAEKPLSLGERIYTPDLVISANSKQKSNIVNLLENAKRENMAIDASPLNDIDVNLIRRQVLADSRQLGGELEFEFGLMHGSNVKAGKIGPSCGKNLIKALPHPETGELVYDLTSAQYGALAQQYKEESISLFPTRWLERTARNAGIDGEVTNQNGLGLTWRGSQGNNPLYHRSGLYLVSDSKKGAKTRAYALTFSRHHDASSMRSGLSFLDHMEDVTDTIFMVSDDVNSRGGAVNITFNNLNQSTMTHELAHIMQNQSGVFADLELAWYRRRMAIPAATEENPLAWRAKPGPQYRTTRMSQFAGYGHDELTVPDDLMSPYAGKTYERELNWDGLKNPALPSKANEPKFNWDDGYDSNRRPSEAVTMGSEGALTLKTETGYDPEDALLIGEYFDENGKKLTGFGFSGHGISTGKADTDYLSFISGLYSSV